MQLHFQKSIKKLNDIKQANGPWPAQMVAARLPRSATDDQVRPLPLRRGGGPLGGQVCGHHGAQADCTLWKPGTARAAEVLKIEPNPFSDPAGKGL